MTIVEFVAELARKDIKLQLEGERLRINAPDGVLSPSLVAQLKDRKAELIAFLSQHRVVSPVETISPQPRPERIPLSYSQQRLWFLAQLDGANAAYNIHAALRLDGPLDIAAFRACWQQLEARHESLRTRFPQTDGIAHQEIHAPNSPVDVVDLAHLSADVQADEVRAQARRAATQMFDLERGPLWNVTLLRLHDTARVLLVTMHHIISDGWSIGILTRELWGLYSDRVSGSTRMVLPPLPIQYADYALWQRNWLSGERREKLLGYWKQQLTDAPPLLNLPTDKPRPAVQSHHGAQLSVILSESLSQRLRTFSQAQNTTLFMTLQAAFTILLARYSGQGDICIGTPIANRTRTETENLIGFFVNTLVLRHRLDDNPSFCDFLARARQINLDAYQHQDLPFEILVDALRPERSLAFSPLFQVSFALQTNPSAPQTLAGLRASHVDVQATESKFDLTLTIHDLPGGLQVTFIYSTDIFERSTIERMARHWRNLLEGILDNPEQPIHFLPLLDETERRRLLVECNDTDRAYPAESRLQGLFEAQVERTPAAAAIECGSQQITYAELNRQANRVAHALIARGVGPDILVGLCCSRSVEMLVGLLGILKAGGAYVPLDPNYPTERVAMMLHDAQIDWILTDPAARAHRAILQHHGQLELDRVKSWTDPDRIENPNVQVTAENLAYVIYTSGSTGTPKGALIPHRAIANYLQWCVETYPYADGCGVPLIGSFSFDGVVPALWGPLLTGRRVILLPEENTIEELCSELRNTPAPYSFVKGTPTHLQALNLLLANSPTTPRTTAVVLGGEALLRETVSTFRSFAPHCRIFNQYGPTEATVACTHYEVGAQLQTDETIPIGRPISNTQIFLLDRHQQLVPIGVPGELHVGGAQLARGYLRRPELTDEKFIRNPFGPGRLYRTGDLCRIRDDGNLEFLGRIDHQVKIRGFRIELGEIEAVLCEQPRVREAVVVVRQDERGKRLVAYVATNDTRPSLTTELREALARVLPDYMVPAAIVALPSLPLTPNGKIDRRALPIPDEQRAENSLVLPRNPTERTLLEIWKRVLRHESISVTDNFFQIGGDSILSIQIVSRARESGLLITTKSIFQHQTIAELAAVAKPIHAPLAEQGIVTGTAPLTPIQKRFFAQRWEQPHHYNQSIFLELDPSAKPHRMRDAFHRLQAHHDALRMRFRCADGDWHQHNEGTLADVPFETHDLTPLTPAERAEQIERIGNALHRSLDLSQGPIWRVAYFDCGQQKRLLVIIHHLVVDGISWRILLEDLESTYRQIEEGRPVQLPTKSTSFKAWATRMHEQGLQIVESERSYWDAIDTSGFSRLPVDHRLGPNDHASAALISTALDVAETNALLHVVPQVYHTQINDLLLAALALALRDFTGQTTVHLNLEGHGREEIFGNDIDISRTIGWFTSVFPVRIEVSSSDLGVTLKSVKEQLRQIPRRGIGFGILRYSSAANDVAEPDLSFNYLGQFDQSTQESLVKRILPESSTQRSPSGPRAHLVDISGVVIEGQLQLQWTYSRNLHRSETIERLVQAYVICLREILRHCQSPNAGGFTPSDFPDAELDPSTLDAVVARIFPPGSQKMALEDLYPLSPAQQGMLIESIVRARGGAFVEQTVLGWKGSLDLSAFARAWQYVAARHPASRTGFLWENLPRPLQFVLRNVPITVVHESLVGSTSEEKRARLDECFAAQRARGFDLTQVPLMRIVVLESEPNRHHIVWTRHHIWNDGWSVAIVLREVLDTYRAEIAGRAPMLEPSRPYHDYVRWLGGQSLSKSEEFWRKRLEGFSRPSALATKSGGQQDKRYAEFNRELSLVLTEKLYALVQKNKLTTNTVVQAAWALVVGWLNDSSDVVFGATVSGRPPEILHVDQIVGPFFSTLPIRVQWNPEMPLVEWLEQMQRSAVEQQSHAYCSAGQIQGWSEIAGSSPLYESILVFQNYPVPKNGADDRGTEFEITDVSFTGAQTQYALTAQIMPATRLRFRMVYHAARFGEADMELMATQWLAALERIVETLDTAPHAPMRQVLQSSEAPPEVFPYEPRAAHQNREMVAARGAIERTLTGIFEQVLGVSDISVRDDFFDLGGHSLVAVRLMAAIRQHFGCNLPLSTLFHAPTVERMATEIRAVIRGQKADWSVLVPIQPGAARLPMYCAPGAGGNVLYLHELSRALGRDQPLYGLQAVGLDGQTAPFSSMEEMARHNVAAILNHQPRGPYVLAGHSFGGKLAFEMARQLIADGHEVAQVFLFDANAPRDVSTRPESRWDEAQWMVGLAEAFASMSGKVAALKYEMIAPLDSDSRMARLKQELERLDILPPDSDPKQARGWLDVFKNNLLLAYTPPTNNPVPLTLFRSLEAVTNDPIALEERKDPALGWQRFTNFPVQIIPAAGNHVTLLMRPHVEQLAAAISQRMKTFAPNGLCFSPGDNHE